MATARSGHSRSILSQGPNSPTVLEKIFTTCPSHGRNRSFHKRSRSRRRRHTPLRHIPCAWPWKSRGVAINESRGGRTRRWPTPAQAQAAQDLVDKPSSLGAISGSVGIGLAGLGCSARGYLPGGAYTPSWPSPLFSFSLKLANCNHRLEPLNQSHRSTYSTSLIASRRGIHSIICYAPFVFALYICTRTDIHHTRPHQLVH